MPIVTATPARIRRSSREAEYARSSSPTVLVNNPDAEDGFANVQESFFNIVADAQVLVDERAAIMTVQRQRIGIETDQPFAIGTTIALTPTLPRARVIDRETELDKTMMIKGIAIDLGAQRNSIEIVG